MNKIMIFNSQKITDQDFSNVMSGLILLGATAVATFICYLIIKECREVCKDQSLCDARALIFRERENVVPNVTEPSFVAMYPTSPAQIMC